MLFRVAARAQGHEIPKRIIALLAPFDLVVYLQVLNRAALLTSPVVALQHLLHDPAVGAYPQLDPLYLFQHLLAGSSSVASDCLVSRA